MGRNALGLSRRGVIGPAMAVTLAVVLLFAIVHAGQPLHFHRGTTSGLYNEAHVLAALESLAGDAPLPAAAPELRLDAAPTRAQLPADAGPDSAPARHADSRAPPQS